jgi:hypothetical protein
MPSLVLMPVQFPEALIEGWSISIPAPKVVISGSCQLGNLPDDLVNE